MDAWHPRDLRGYGRHPPDPQWPGGARLVLQCVLNVEEGAERTILNGDDLRYLVAPGCATAGDFFTLLRDAFDLLWAEGESRPAIMTLGLHSRISGHPARAVAVARFLDHAASRDGVWICRRREIAEHWIQRFGSDGCI